MNQAPAKPERIIYKAPAIGGNCKAGKHTLCYKKNCTCLCGHAGLPAVVEIR